MTAPFHETLTPAAKQVVGHLTTHLADHTSRVDAYDLTGHPDLAHLPADVIEGLFTRAVHRALLASLIDQTTADEITAWHEHRRALHARETDPACALVEGVVSPDEWHTSDDTAADLLTQIATTLATGQTPA